MAKLDLGKQVGPMPLGAWVAVVGAGLGIAYYTKGGAGSLVGSPDDALAEDTFVEDTSGDPGVGEGGFVFTPPPVVTGGVLPPVDNDEWSRRAISELITANYDPAWVNAAITHAMFGERLSVREWSIWREALRRLGPPPFPINVPPPKSVPSKHPPKHDGHPEDKHHEDRHHRIGRNVASTERTGDRWFRVRMPPLPGSTLRGIAKLAYGDPNKWRTIYAANRKGKELPRYKGQRREGQLTDPNRLPAGTLLYIPRG